MLNHININEPLKILATDSFVTRIVKTNYNRMTNEEFMRAYQTTKKVYAKRVKRYGDPYMRAPLARLGKWLAKVI